MNEKKLLLALIVIFLFAFGMDFFRGISNYYERTEIIVRALICVSGIYLLSESLTKRKKK